MALLRSGTRSPLAIVSLRYFFRGRRREKMGSRRAAGLAMMACRFGLLLITILPFTVFAQTAKPDAHPFLVTMGEAWSNPQPSAGPINAMNCVIIFPDGQLHLELSRQEFFAEKLDLRVYEASLNGQELLALRDLLNSDPIRQLRPFDFFTPFLSSEAHQASVFSARISRADSRQQVGYFAPEEGRTTGSPSARREWKESEVVLRPLVQWFRELKTSKPRAWRQVANSKANSCEPQ